MAISTIYIKNMVCDRCVMAVEQTLTKLNIPFTVVKLGQAVIDDTNVDFDLLDKELRAIGFEMIKDKNAQIIEKIKTLIIDYIHHYDGEDLKINFSDYLSRELSYDYSYISSVFSENENVTIEKFIILQKIERVKELISYNELNFSEIAYKVNYSSAAHLSRQFKSVTGLTLSEYKKSETKDRSTLDKI